MIYKLYRLFVQLLINYYYIPKVTHTFSLTRNKVFILELAKVYHQTVRVFLVKRNTFSISNNNRKCKHRIYFSLVSTCFNSFSKSLLQKNSQKKLLSILLRIHIYKNTKRRKVMKSLASWLNIAYVFMCELNQNFFLSFISLNSVQNRKKKTWTRWKI